MFVLFGTVTAVIITALQLALFVDKRKFGKCVHSFLNNEFVINLISLLLLRNVFKYKHIFDTSAYGISSFIKYFVMSLAVGLAWLVFVGVVEGKLAFVVPERKKSKGAAFLKVLSFVFALLGSIMYFSTVWGKEAYGNISGDQFIINLLSPTTGTENSVYIEFFEEPFFGILLVVTAFSLFAFSKFNLVLKNEARVDRVVFNDIARLIFSLLLSLAVLGYGAYYCIDGFNLKDVYLSYFMKSDFIEENFADPEKTEIVFPEKKRNLIHIYLESMENSYLSKDLGSNVEESLMPGLTELANEGIVFSDNESKFGGPLQATGTQ